MLKKFFFNILFSLITSLVIITPNLITKYALNLGDFAFQFKFFGFLLFFALIISFTGKNFIRALLSLLLLVEFIQFGHFFYYNKYIDSAKLKLFFLNFDEVLSGAKEASRFLFYVPLITLLPYLTAILTNELTEKKRIFIKNWSWLCLIICTILPIRILNHHNQANYFPDPVDFSVRNSLYAFGNMILNIVDQKPEKQYLAYQVTKKAEKQNNIILIIGESVNYQHMEIFGYHRPTNPLLKKLLKQKNFIIKPSISSGVSTDISIPLLINGIREPGNVTQIQSNNSNLFKLAKEQNYQTFFISAQSGALLSKIASEYIDIKLFRNQSAKLFAQLGDEALLKIISGINFKEKNFVVINQRNAHTPYEENYRHNENFKVFPINAVNFQDFLINSYDNCMLLNDFIIYQLIELFAKKFDSPTYVFFTSDHGEILNLQSSAFGHANLHEDVAKIPFIFYSKNYEENLFKQFPEIINHYEIHQIIAQLLGYKIVNPNHNGEKFYIQGLDLTRHNQFIEYHKDSFVDQ